mmetsp:Transcript_3784/g.5011  ORF Transcript_3784/g.5011 Transcript_3784/m.5011 type:complete len:224 (-) Transcript_3784:968-1639(-)
MFSQVVPWETIDGVPEVTHTVGREFVVGESVVVAHADALHLRLEGEEDVWRPVTALVEFRPVHIQPICLIRPLVVTTRKRLRLVTLVALLVRMFAVEESCPTARHRVGDLLRVFDSERFHGEVPCLEYERQLRDVEVACTNAFVQGPQVEGKDVQERVQLVLARPCTAQTAIRALEHQISQGVGHSVVVYQPHCCVCVFAVRVQSKYFFLLGLVLKHPGCNLA